MLFSVQSSVSRSAHYRPDIDGLRGIAVLAVLLFHAGIAGFSGGFVGVDIFFVISGYLITSILRNDIENRKFSLVSFYDRRIRRIFPALLVVLLFSTLTATLVLTPSELTAFGKSMVSAALFVSNFFFARPNSHSGYLGTGHQRQVLLHTWSLSVEEQFYLLFPLTLFFLMRWMKGRAKIWLLIMCVISFCLNVRMTHYKPVDAFYMSLPRAWELLAGSLLAMRITPPLANRWARELAAATGLILMIFAIHAYSGSEAFPGVRAALPCLGAWLCIYSGEHGASVGRRVLSFKPLVFLGVISYSLYLWHWPIIVFTRCFFAVSSISSKLSTEQTAGVIGAALICAVLSFELVERPFRGPDSRFSRRSIFRLGFAGSLASAAFGFVFYASHGLPGRYDAATKEIILENEARRDDFDEVCGNWKTDVRSLSDIHLCVFGGNSPKKIMFWGDSHVQQLYPVVEKEYKNGGLGGHGTVFAVENGCVPFEHLNSLDDKSYHCDRFASIIMRRAEEPDIDTVFIAFNARWSVDGDLCFSQNWVCVRELSRQEMPNYILEELSSEVRELRSYGKRVVVSLPFPWYDKPIPELKIRNAEFARFGLGETTRDLVPSWIRDQIASVAESAGAEIFDPRASLCTSGPCITQLGGVSIYVDNNHIAKSQIFILDDNLRQALKLSGPLGTNSN